MFGAPLREHDQRYDHLAEWLDVIKKLWSSDEEFDHHGEFFDVVRGISIPKPVQQPGPPIMNAGHSERGRLFACEHADLCFVGLRTESFESTRDEVEKYKRTASERFGREVQVWAHTYVVQRETQKEAEDYLEYYAVTNQDRECVDAWLDAQAQEMRDMPRELLESLRIRYAAGFGGFPLVGTAERIVEKLNTLSKAGLNGVLLTWVDFADGVKRFNRDVLPMLEQAGLRRPFKGVPHLPANHR
jgi:alkanesulfonate monooxygenase SsuD/methylene tetrahydromethanopterin reductase-like flavin-dependent oxidoreductase (luciferase family)